jgi:hypothetical protein
MARLFRLTILMVCFLCAGRAFAAGGTCPSGANYSGAAPFSVNATLGSLGVTTCYFIAANGSDSNDGASESTPWAHLPGMPTCTSNCGAHTPTAGEGYILRGGDTWNGSNLGLAWNWSGSASNPIYIGVDQGWYSAGSWSRPIWTCGGATCSGNPFYFTSSKANVILDNIELTGMYSNSQGFGGVGYIYACGQNQTYENLYAHGWSHNPAITSSVSGGFILSGCGSNTTGLVIRYNVGDGSDTSRDMMYGVTQSAPIAYGNYFRYMTSGINACGDNWHDNVIEYSQPPAGGGHEDLFYNYGPCYASNVLMYSNIARHTVWNGANGDVKFWISGLAPNTATYYAFNNVLYDNTAGNMVDVGASGAHPPGTPYGTVYFFNNTVDCGTDAAPGACLVGDNGNSGGFMTLILNANHWITTGPILTCTKTFACTETGDLLQTLSQAQSQGYSDSSPFAFQPTSANGSTITAAANSPAAAAGQALCATIGNVDAGAGAACQSDTTYACTYNTTNHTVFCPARVTVARAASPNIGAYQFSSTQAATPNPPTGLAISVQ